MPLRHTERAYYVGLLLARHQLFELTRRPVGRFGILRQPTATGPRLRAACVAYFSPRIRDTISLELLPRSGATRRAEAIYMQIEHLANATLRGRIEKVCRDAGYEPPIICTPEELVEVDNDI
jgi:hypothetical protein